MRIVILLIFLCSCSAKQLPSLEQRAKVKSLIENARVEIKQGQIGKAAALVSIAEQLAPFEANVIDAKGCIAWYRKDYLNAKRYFKEAIATNPLFENSYVNLAYIEEQKGRVATAKKILEKVLKMNPLNHKARNNYAALLYDNVDRELAKAQLQMALGSVKQADQILISNERTMR